MTHDLSNRFLSVMSAERDRITSRRSLLGKTALVGGGAALAMTAFPAFRASAQDALEADPYFEDDGIAILNYALTLEHLESVFYREALATFTPEEFDNAGSVYDLLVQIGDHEAAHVEALTATISDLGGEPVEELSYDFGYSDVDTFLATAAAIENVGVAAYAGAAPSVAVLAPSLVATALGIHSVEARHASFLGFLAFAVAAADSPFPDAVDAPLTPEEVLEIAGPFIVSGAAATPAATPAADGDTVAVEMFDFGFEPAELEIAAGTTVTWTNIGQEPHNAVADDDSFATSFLNNGGSESYTFTEPGTFPYVCTLHAGMMQAVVVVT